jgi:hypothetical protein
MPSKFTRPYGMPRLAFEAYCLASERAEIDLADREDHRLVQIIGNAPASAGFHLRETGADRPVARIDNEPYSACYDLSVKGLGWTQVATWLEELCRVGIPGWFRYKGSFVNNRHIHCIAAFLPMKEELRQQCRNFWVQDDALVGDGRIDDSLYPSPELVNIPRGLFARSNGSAPQVIAPPLHIETPQISNALYFGLQTKPALWMPVVNGVSLAPVRAYGSALGFDVHYISSTRSVKFDGRDVPVPTTNIAGVRHAPIRALAKFSGLQVSVNVAERAVWVRHEGQKVGR